MYTDVRGGRKRGGSTSRFGSLDGLGNGVNPFLHFLGSIRKHEEDTFGCVDGEEVGFLFAWFFLHQ